MAKYIIVVTRRGKRSVTIEAETKEEAKKKWKELNLPGAFPFPDD